MSAIPPRAGQHQLPPLDVPAGLGVEYANLVRIAHSPSELVFDFAHLLPGSLPAQVRARIVMSPLGAKLFYRALAENLAKYEAAFGEIPVPGSSSLAEHLFRPSGTPEGPRHSPGPEGEDEPKDPQDE